MGQIDCRLYKLDKRVCCHVMPHAQTGYQNEHLHVSGLITALGKSSVAEK